MLLHLSIGNTANVNMEKAIARSIITSVKVEPQYGWIFSIDAGRQKNCDQSAMAIYCLTIAQLHALFGISLPL